MIALLLEFPFLKKLYQGQKREHKLENRKAKDKMVKFKMPPITEILSGEWLSDLHIKAVSNILKMQFPAQNGLHDPKLGDLSFPATKFPFVQILYGGNHWLTVEGVSSSLVRIYDTLTYSSSNNIQSQIAALLCCENKSITIEVRNIQRQTGMNDCALFAMAYAVDLSYGNDPSTLWYYQHKLRQHLVECLELKKLTPFPSRACHPSKVLIIDLPVYCICWLTEDENDSMAKCERCLEWFHKSCEDIPEVIFEDPSASWLCGQCV